MLMNTTFLGDSFSIKWQSRGITQFEENQIKKLLIFSKKFSKYFLKIFDYFISSIS